PFEPGCEDGGWSLWGQVAVCVHEHQHVEQLDRDGWLKFAGKYLLVERWPRRLRGRGLPLRHGAALLAHRGGAQPEVARRQAQALRLRIDRHRGRREDAHHVRRDRASWRRREPRLAEGHRLAQRPRADLQGARMTVRRTGDQGARAPHPGRGADEAEGFGRHRSAPGGRGPAQRDRHRHHQPGPGRRAVQAAVPAHPRGAQAGRVRRHQGADGPRRPAQLGRHHRPGRRGLRGRARKARGRDGRVPVDVAQVQEFGSNTDRHPGHRSHAAVPLRHAPQGREGRRSRLGQGRGRRDHPRAAIPAAGLPQVLRGRASSASSGGSPALMGWGGV
ncbi:MAG: hypothetical protein MZV63_31760, partial [Marinilabiliales bacterium]|nr:hypothetical protein [Marinilabiliales bacterium]